MKKISATSQRPSLKAVLISRRLSLFTKLSLGTAMVALLSSASPVLAKKIDIIDQQVLQSMEKAISVYSQGNDKRITAAYDSQNNVDVSDLSKAGYVTALNKVGAKVGAEKVKASSDYANFLNDTLWEKSRPTINVFSKPINEGGMTTRLIPVDGMQRETRANQGVALGNQAQATEYSSIAIGNYDPQCVGASGGLGCVAARSLAERGIAIGLSSEVNKSEGIAIGVAAKAFAEDAIVLGSFANVTGKDAIAIGRSAEVSNTNSIAMGLHANAAGSNSLALGFSAKAETTNTIALGSNAKVSGQDSVAVGRNANAAGDAALALGFEANAKETSAIALGLKAEASGPYSISIGAKGKASDWYSVGLGYGVEVAGERSIALGYQSKVSFKDGVAIGSQVEAKAVGAIVLGSQAKAKEVATIALGSKVEASDPYDIIIGSKGKVSGWQSIGLGYGVEVAGERSIALGYQSKASVDNGVAIGSFSISDRAAGVAGYTSLLQGSATDTKAQWKSTRGAVSIGDPSNNITRQITGVAAGSGDADAVNVAQLKGLEEVVRKNGWKLSVNGENAKTVLLDSDIDFSAGSQNFAITKSNDDNKVKFDLAKDLTLKSIKLEEESVSDDRADAVSSVTLDTTGLIIKNGPKVTTSGIDAGSKKITGVKEGTDNTDAVNFGQLQKVEKDVKEQVAASSFVKQDVKTKYITIGKETDGDKIDITNKKNEQRTLTGLKSASLSEASNEAVTGSQLFATNKNVTTLSDNFKIAATNMAKYFGGDAGYENGKWTDPTFKIKTVNANGEEKEESYKNVAAALAGVGNSITNVKNDIKNEITSVKGDSLVKWDEDTKHINIGSEKEDATINIADKESNNRILSGVKKAEKGNEAVNKDQLDENVKKLSGEIADVRSVAVFYDKEEVSDDDNRLIRSARKSNKSNVTFGDPSKGTVGLHNVGDGKVADVSTDAINGSQLHSFGTGVAKALGGNAKYENGEWTAPSFTVKTFKEDSSGVEEHEYDTVSAAFEGVGTSFTNVNNAITDIKKEITKEVADAKSDALNWSKAANAFVATHGKENSKTNSKITSLQDGDITAASSDAITGGQLFETNSKVASYLGGGASYQDKTWTDPTFKVKAVNGEGKEEEKTYKNVGEALSGVGNSITNVKNDITKQIKNEISNVKGDSLVKKDAATNVINIGKEVEGSEINVANKSGGSRTLSGVKEATKDNEAVNKGQLDKDLKKLSESLQSEDSAVVHYDKDDKNGSINYTSVTLGGKEKKPVALHNLSDGKIAKDSHDAINGSQLHTLGSTVASYFGGDTRYEDGQWSTPNFKLKQFSEDGKSEDKTYQNVSDALSGVSSSLTNVKNTITNEMKKTKGDALLWGKEEGAFVAQHGEKEENSKITSLRDGVISSVSTDAVTGKQLYSVGHALSTYLGGDTRYENGEWTAPSFKITTVKEDGSSEDKTYENVTAAFAGVGTSFTNVQSKITNDINTAITNVKGDSLVKWDEKTKRINIGGEKEDATISIADKDSKDRILSGVKDAEHSNEAVNKGQLDKEIADVRSVAVFYDEEEAADEPHLFTRSLRKVNKSSVTFGDPKTGPVGLHNVGNGKVTEDSHDAINGSQLFETNSKVASYLGGGTGYKDKAWTSPTFKVKTVKDDGKEEEQTYHNVSDALTGVGSSIANVQNKVTEQVNNAITTFKGDALLWGATDNAFSAQHEKDGAKTNSKITHILDGNISKDSTDAITGNQLHSLGDKVAGYLGGSAKYEDGTWTDPTFTLKTVKADGTTDEQSYTSVSAAFEGVGTSFTNIKNEITKQINNLQSEDSAVVHYDKKEKDEIDYTNVTLGKGKDSTPVALHNVANGNIAKDSRDAITGDQMNKIGEDIAKFLGGESSFKDGSLTPPSYALSEVSTEGKVTDKSFNDVGSAFVGLDKNIKHVNDRIKEVSEGVAQDSLSWSATNNAFSAQHGKDSERTDSKITHLKVGDITETSTDAINGSQLYSLGDKVAQSFGGNAEYKDGSWTAPSFTLKTFNENGEEKEESYKNVAEAFTGVGTSITNVKNDITKQINNEISNVKGESLVKWDEETKHINIGGEKDGATINIADKGSNNRILSGLKKAEKDNEAVNKEQLDENVTKLSDEIAEVRSVAVFYDEEEAVDEAHLFTRSLRKVNKNSVTFGDPKTGTVGLHNVGSGAISSDSHDAINGSQVHSLGSTVASYFGGDAKYENGQWTAPNFKVKTINTDGQEKDETYQNVSTAFEGVGSSFTNIKNEITKQVNNLQSEGSAVVHYDKKAEGGIDYTSVTLGGKDQTLTVLHNVGDGKIGDNSHDAINGGQIYKVGEDIAKFLGGDASFKDGSLTQPTYKLSNVATDGEVTDNSFNDVGTAFSGLDKNIQHVNDRIKEVSQGVAKDSLNWSSAEGAFVASHGEGDARKDSKIAHILSGDITETSTDAVNGSQLFDTNKIVATYLGGGAGYEEGKWTAPSFKVKIVKDDGSAVEEQSYENVSAAFEGVGTSFTNIKNEITNQINHLQSEDSAVVHYDKKAEGEIDYTSVTLGGKDQTPTLLHNVGDGQIGDKSYDAINGGQIYKIGEDVAKFFGGDAAFNNGAFTGPTYKLSNVDEKGNVTDKPFSDVGSAFVGLDTNIKHVNDRIKEVSEGVAQDTLSWSKEKGAFVAVHGEDGAKSNSKITSLLDGTVSKGSTDAVTGSQLFDTNKTVATYLGGGAKYEEGKWTAPSFKVKTVKDDGSDVEEQSYESVSAAFEGVGTSFTNIKNEITNQINHLQSEDSAVVHYNKKKDGKTDYGNITFGGKDEVLTALHNVGNGKIAEDSHDAINGSQLFATDKKVSIVSDNLQVAGTNIAKVLGGGAKYEEDKWTAPSFKVKTVKDDGSDVEEQSYESVSAAFEGVGTSFTNIHKELKNEITKVVGDSLVKQDAESKVIKIGAEKGGASINIANSGDAARTLTGVKSGALTETSTDAVNGSQLYSMNNTLASYFGGGAGYKEGKWSAPSFKVKTVKDDGSAVEEQSYESVSAAFEGVGASFTNIHKELKNEITKVVGDSLVKQDKETRVIAVGGEKSGTEV
uniref:hypothetical protein n=1 Tax=Bartonella sp. MM73XJBT.G TaxID=3019097 RepID=UPI00235F622D